MRNTALRLAMMATMLSLAIPTGAHAAAVGINIPGGAAAGSLVGAAAATGATTGRVFLTYQGGSAPDAGTLAAYDGIVDGMVAAGVKPVIVVSGNGHPPADVDAYAQFVGSLAQHYAGKVAAWELWNEEDEAIWWGNAGGDPTTYARLLRATYPLVHPYAQVFLGPLTGNNYGFLDQVYAALGGSSAGAFDGVAAHTDTACSLVAPDSYLRDPNGRINRYSFLGFRELYASMLAHGDQNKPIWLTELGWNTASGPCTAGVFAGQKNAGVSAADQARYLAMAWHCLRDYPYVTNAMWFTLIDGTAQDEGSYGLLNADGSQKPSYAAFHAVATGVDVFAGQPCGDFAPPGIAVTEPQPGTRFSGQLPIRASATDPSGVARITLFADGVKIRNFANSVTRAGVTYPSSLPAAIDWQGAKKLAPGAHTIRVQAVDAFGNTSTQDVSVTKTSGGSSGGGGGGDTVPAKTASVGPVTGTVCVKQPKSNACVPLRAGDSIPVGSIVDTTHGSVTLTVSDGHGGSYTGTFSGGVFLFTQRSTTAVARSAAFSDRKHTHKKRRILISDLKLVGGDFAVCPKTSRRRSVAEGARRRVVRYLQAKAHGKFNVIGKRAAGIERGTSWRTTDTCDATEIKVTKGSVLVTDFAKHKRFVVKAGHTYRATGKAAKQKRRR